MCRYAGSLSAILIASFWIFCAFAKFSFIVELKAKLPYSKRGRMYVVYRLIRFSF